MTKAFGYLRVSGLGQVDGQGFDRQLAAIQKYAETHDIEIVHVYREEGITGKSDLDGRPSLQELIADLLNGEIRLVLIEKLDRLARALIVQETILQDLTRKGITMISVSEPDLCTDDPTRTLIRQILGSFFEYERKMIVSKLADSRRRVKARDGKCEGRKAFGDKPGEKEILERIVNMKAMSYTPTEIATCLNVDGAATRYSKRWHAATISKILRRS